MKMVKSLLLGSAAGLVAVAGAQAADLPVKAKPVEYVKVCTLYGAGYYYIPGTDVCMKVGGYVRQEWAYQYGNDITAGPWAGIYGFNNRIDGSSTTTGQPTLNAADTVWRTRAYMNFDARQQTAYGTLRAYLQIGINGNNNIGFSANRAFIQIAGFTVGLASSYFDFHSVAAISYLTAASSDTGDGGLQVFAYTAQLGNGVSASLSLEQPRRRARINTGGAEITLGGTGANGYGKLQAPDIVGNIRISQAWGSAQVMGALHQVNAGYYTPSATGAAGGQNTGYPSDVWGWAVGAGLRINFPMIGPGDYLSGQVAYTQGAHKYVSNTPSSPIDMDGGQSLGYGYASDAVMTDVIGSSIQLTTAWGVAAGYEHFWTPSLRTSIHGGYYETKYNATANEAICDSQVAGGAGTLTLAGNADCNNNWSMWQIGSRTQWNVTRDFYMGFDVLYAKLNTASKGAVAAFTAAGAQPSGDRTIEDQDVIAARVRWHRDIAP
jgi:hypothetical protein